MRFRFVKGAPAQYYSDDDFYALCNGYCDPESILADGEQARAVRDAAALLQAFFEQARDAGAIGEM